MAYWLPKFFAFIAILAFPLGASALQPDRGTPLYRLQISLFDGDRLVGQPNVTVAQGKPAIITVEKKGGYSIRVVAARDDAQPQNSRLRVAAEVFYRDDTGWRQVAAPRLTLALGTKSTVETQTRTAPVLTFRMEVLATEAAGATASKPSRPCTEAVQGAWRRNMTQPSGVAALKAASGFQDGLGDCCSTGCLRCCGDSGTCCEDPLNCVGGCCV